MVELCASLIGALSEVRLSKVADHFFSVRPGLWCMSMGIAAKVIPCLDSCCCTMEGMGCSTASSHCNQIMVCWGLGR